MKKNKQKKLKYYAIVGKTDKFLHGIFPPSEEGLTKAKLYLVKIDPTKKNLKIKKF
jgi:hypothetical protein